MNVSRPAPPHRNATRIALAAALASALASATDFAFATYFGGVLVVLAIPQLAACLRTAAMGKR